ncbi:hypothetical protein [uncultured Aureimonas sp.]|uniref:hypothetical protein n=1 Tax=uncultured Aureimonas sp. TaxID=1604662 RepID=UPI0025CE06DD|nr:hypothetical protein [uncultured Aureimonas sp.]
MTYILQPNGTLLDANGLPFAAAEVSDLDIAVPHLLPHVIPFVMPKGQVLGLRAIYSSHCWTEGYDPAQHVPTPMIFRDGRKARVFNQQRFDDSKGLAELLSGLAERRVYWTPSDRNFGVYNATAIVDGVAYTAFFTLTKERGRVDGVRYHLTMGVESAYRAEQPSAGMKLKAAAAVDAAMNGRRLVYRR